VTLAGDKGLWGALRRAGFHEGGLHHHFYVLGIDCQALVACLEGLIVGGVPCFGVESGLFVVLVVSFR
jgi:hypothetical protein